MDSSLLIATKDGKDIAETLLVAMKTANYLVKSINTVSCVSYDGKSGEK